MTVALAGALLLRLAVVNSLFNLARTRNGPHRIARRKTLAAAREYFRRELRSPSPRLEDAWFPYIVAFGLAGGVEKWFRAYGGAGEHAATASSFSGSRASSGSSSSSSSASPSGGWTGGGGSFGGAGASASWAAAAGSLAAGVSAPSSSSSGGAGAEAPGGGGGGGW